MGGYAAYRLVGVRHCRLVLMVGLFVQSRQAARRREAELEQLRQVRPRPRGGPPDARRVARSDPARPARREAG